MLLDGSLFASDVGNQRSMRAVHPSSDVQVARKVRLSNSGHRFAMVISKASTVAPVIVSLRIDEQA